MKYFIANVTLQYDGYEWTQKVAVEAESEEAAARQVEATDYTHQNGIEVQSLSMIQEIPADDYQVLRKYI